MPRDPVVSRNPKFERGGIVNISGAFLLDHEEDILNLVKHQGKLAAEKNAEHRVININKASGGIVVLVSDHNLAMKIGKALTHAYKGDHQYKFAQGEQFVEINWRRD